MNLLTPKRSDAAPHHCHADGCTKEVRPELLMCHRHWYRVPPQLRRAVRAAYRAGQCVTKNPSWQWRVAAHDAIAAVAASEGRLQAAKLHRELAARWRRRIARPLRHTQRGAALVLAAIGGGP